MDFSKAIKIVESSIFKTQFIYVLNIIISLLFIAVQGITLPNLAIVLSLFFMMNCLGITVTYHRYWTHNSFAFRYKWLEKLCTLCGILSGSGSSIGWVNIHRQHHAHSDTELDPHSAEKGFFKNPILFKRVDLCLSKWCILDGYNIKKTLFMVCFVQNFKKTLI